MLYNDINASRKPLKTKFTVQSKLKKHPQKPIEQPNLSHYEQLKEFSTEHKEELIRYVENKYQLLFHQDFDRKQINLLRIDEEKLIQKNYDSFKKSYYLLFGKLKLKEIRKGKREMLGTKQEYFRVLFQQFKVEEDNNGIYLIKEQMGIGYLFNGLKYSHLEIYAQNAVLLQINHSADNLQYIIRNFLLSHKEKANILKNYSLFKSIDNFQKVYLHYFNVLKFKKGEIIYQINDESHQFYLIIQGSVQFQLKLTQPAQPQIDNMLSLSRKNDKPKNSSIITETINKFSYFGEEEILIQSLRKLNARCKSVQCVLLTLPAEIFQKLLQTSQFRNQILELASRKEEHRQQKITNFISLKQQTKIQNQLSNEYLLFKSSIFNLLEGGNQDHNSRIQLPNKKKNVKILHNNEIQQIQVNKNARPEGFFMLDINKSLYDNTLKRFRLSLQEVRRMKEPISQYKQKGRSLQNIWKILKLQKSIYMNQNRFRVRNSSGLKYYNAHCKIKTQLKLSKSLKPRYFYKQFSPKIDKKLQLQLIV